MRPALIFTMLGLLALALARTGAEPESPNYALSLPGQSELTFWANHRGLSEWAYQGPVGLGEFARGLMRRRGNAARIRPLRDRFFFVTGDVRDFHTPDILGALLREGGLEWTARPRSMIVTVNRAATLPLIVESRVPAGASIRVNISGDHIEPSSFTAPSIRGPAAAAYWLRIRAQKAGPLTARVTLTAGGFEREFLLPLDARPIAKLHVRLEADSGEPASARIYLTAADGLAYVPEGLVSRIAAMPAEPYFYAKSEFSLDVPAGVTVIEATRGLEYELSKQAVMLAPGDNPVVHLRLRRWISMARRGWYSADSHIHSNYVANHHQSITPEDVQLQMQAEDLNVANMVIANSYTDFIHDEALFEGRPHRLSTPRHILYWNEEMRGGSFFGHMCFFNLKRLVDPLYTGIQGTSNPDDYPPNYTQAKAAIEQGAAVTYAHPGYLATATENGAKELPVDLALGQVHGMDVLSNSFETAGMKIYHHLLNCGFRLTASAGTDSFTNLVDHYIPGGGRVYVHTDGAFDYSAWIDAFKQGHSFVTNGPMVFLDVEGRAPGDELRLPATSAATVRVRASVISRVPIDRLEILANAKTVAIAKANGRLRFALDRTLALPHSAWIAARVEGPWNRRIANDAYAFAHTTPVYVSIGEEPIAVREDIRFFIDWIEQLQERIQRHGKFSSESRRDGVVRLFGRALEVFRRREAAASGPSTRQRPRMSEPARGAALQRSEVRRN